MQASLIMRILRGQYKAVVGYSAELVDLIKRCLTQAAARRPNTGAEQCGLPTTWTHVCPHQGT